MYFIQLDYAVGVRFFRRFTHPFKSETEKNEKVAEWNRKLTTLCPSSILRGENVQERARIQEALKNSLGLIHFDGEIDNAAKVDIKYYNESINKMNEYIQTIFAAIFPSSTDVKQLNQGDWSKSMTTKQMQNVDKSLKEGIQTQAELEKSIYGNLKLVPDQRKALEAELSNYVDNFYGNRPSISTLYQLRDTLKNNLSNIAASVGSLQTKSENVYNYVLRQRKK